MGKVTAGLVRGSVAGYVYREVGGEQIIQSKPGAGQTRMSDITMQKAANFGTGSSLAFNIRESFQKSINAFYDGGMVNRLSSEVNAILKQSRDKKTDSIFFDVHSFSTLSGFDFNLLSPMRAQIGFQLQTGLEAGRLQVQLPQIQIPSQLKFPAESNRCELTLSLALLRPAEGYRIQYPERRSVIVTKDQRESDAALFNFNVPSGCLYILTLSLRYTFLRGNLESLINHKKFNPVTILEAGIAPGSYTGGDELEWIDMPNVKINSSYTN